MRTLQSYGKMLITGVKSGPIKWPCFNRLFQAISAEANIIFKDRLVTDDEKAKYNVVCRNHLKCNTSVNTCYIPKLKGDGVYLEGVEYEEWCLRTQKLINQCC
jgi:hypothetical protein